MPSATSFSPRYYSRPGSGDTSYFHLYRINADGSRRLQITHGNFDDESTEWSPDGRKILFSRAGRDTSASTLCIVNADGSDLKTLRVFDADSGYFAHWTPDGNIAISHSHWLNGLPPFYGPSAALVFDSLAACAVHPAANSLGVT